MKAKAFLVRCQSRGVLTDRVYLRPPTDKEMRAELGKALAHHGHDARGKVRERWVTYVPCELVGGEDYPSHDYPDTVPLLAGKLTPAESKVLLAKPSEPSGHVKAEAMIGMKGAGTVVNPGDDGHAEAVAAIKAKK